MLLSIICWCVHDSKLLFFLTSIRYETFIIFKCWISSYNIVVIAWINLRKTKISFTGYRNSYILNYNFNKFCYIFKFLKVFLAYKLKLKMLKQFLFTWVMTWTFGFKLSQFFCLLKLLVSLIFFNSHKIIFLFFVNSILL